MTDQHGWLSGDAADLVLGEIREVIDEVTAQVHASGGEELKPVQNALKNVVFRLQAAERRMQVTLRGGVALGVATVPDGGPGLVTADVVRRMRRNAGGAHRAKP